jgi:hypothetical protein
MTEALRLKQKVESSNYFEVFRNDVKFQLIRPVGTGRTLEINHNFEANRVLGI